MRRTAALVILLALPACGTTPCPSEPLAPLPAPQWVVRFNEPPPMPVVRMIPGRETFVDPPGSDTYAAFAIYDGAGAVLNERWLDTYTTWDGATVSANAATTLPSSLGRGALTLLFAESTRPFITFDVTTGEVARQLSTYGAPPEVAGQLVDVLELGDGTALISRRRGPGGVGGDVLLLDVEGERGLIESFRVADLSAGRAAPTWIAALGAAGGLVNRAVVGLALFDEGGAGAVAVIDLERTEIRRVDVPGLSWCTGVAALEPDPAVADAARAAVLCTGDVMQPPEDRNGAGVVLLEAAADGTVRLATTRTAAALFSGRPPSTNLVALAGDWIAFVSRGDAEVPRPDALVAVHLSSDAGELLHEEQWREGFGEALGQGDYAGELWWPSVQHGILRWSMTGSGSDATFTSLSATPTAGCSVLSPRVVRALGPAAPPPMDGGVPDAGPMEGGMPMDAGPGDAGPGDAASGDAGSADAGVPLDAGTDAG